MLYQFSDNLRVSQQSTITSFAELKRPPPPPPKNEQPSKTWTFGFSLLRNKTSNASSIDNRNNVSRTHSFLSVPLSQPNNCTLPVDINNIRRSPSPKSYHAPPIPTAPKLNHPKDKDYNVPNIPKLSPKNNKMKTNMEDNKCNSIQFKLISNEGMVV